MTPYSKRVQELHSKHVENIRHILDLGSAMANSPSGAPDPTADRMLANEFRSYLEQTENYIESIEDLLQRCSGKRPA